MIASKAEILTLLGKTDSLSAADEALLAMLHPLVESAVEGYLQFEVGYKPHVEYLPIGQSLSDRDLIQEPYLRNTTVTFSHVPPGADTLQLKHTPVWLSGLEVREDVGAFAGQASVAFGSDTILAIGDDYYLDVDDAAAGISRTGILYRFGRWPTEPRSIKATYYGGVSHANLAGAWGDIKLAAAMSVSHCFQLFKSRQDDEGPKQSESIGGYSYSLVAAFANEVASGGAAVPAGAKSLLFRHRNFGRLFG